jgi:uncharacterized protein YodC (DUF2158 family)
METENLKPGDLVRLRSGGPALTVQFIDSNGDVFCQWFEPAHLKTALFKPKQIVPADVPVDSPKELPLG